jgi:tRNA A37 threonylcarbamoyladenosine dehydratase
MKWHKHRTLYSDQIPVKLEAVKICIIGMGGKGME